MWGGVVVGCDAGPDVHSLLVMNTLSLDKVEGPGGHSLEMMCSRCPRGVISALQCLKSSDLEESTGTHVRDVLRGGMEAGQGVGDEWPWEGSCQPL